MSQDVFTLVTEGGDTFDNIEFTRYMPTGDTESLRSKTGTEIVGSTGCYHSNKDS